MQLIARVFRVAAAAVLGTVIAATPADALGIEGQKATYFLRSFSDSDEVGVTSHFVRYNLLVARGPEIKLQFNHESVTVPGVAAPIGSQEAVDAITSASRPVEGGLDAFRDFTKHRNEVTGDVVFDRASAGYYVSLEEDYFAQQVRGAYNHDFFQQNTNLSVGARYGWDHIKPLSDADTPGTQDRRTTLHGNAVLTQTLTPTTVVRVGAEVNRVRGLQHNPYRNVYADGSPAPERHPENRIRRAAFVKLQQYLKNRSSVRAHYTLYSDSWGVEAHTMGAGLSQYVGRDFVIRYRYRFHTQTEAEFYREEYTDANGVDGYLSADYRLESFQSHLFGAQVDWHLATINRNHPLWRKFDLRIKYERYFNTNNFSANVLESGLTYRF